MTNKRPVAIDHTHEPSTKDYDGFQSKSDKALIDILRLDKVKYDNAIFTTKEPTGFTNNQNITVSYDSTTRKVTLSGTFEAYYKGNKVRELIDGWVSDAHDVAQGVYYLYYCDSGFVFSTTPWDFSCLMIAFIQYNSHQIGIREVHGFMPHDTHKEFHNVIGSYLVSGGDLSGYVLNSTTVADRRPLISNTIVADEDLDSTVLALSSASYTQRYLSGSAVRSFNIAQPEIIAVSGNQPYYNLNTGGTWTQALFLNNSYGAIFVVAVPTTNDAGSQTYRYMFVQPQLNSSSLAEIQALTPNSLVHGVSSSLVSEFVFFAKIIIRYTGGNWSITSVEKLTGTKIAQTSNVVGSYLTVVSHDTSLSGDGTVSSPLVVVDGSGSGLDADLLDGKESTSFIRKDAGSISQSAVVSITSNENLIVQENSTGSTGFPTQFGQTWLFSGETYSRDFAIYKDSGSYNLYFSGINSTRDGFVGWNKIWDSGNDGIGSGLNADLLDGNQGSYYQQALVSGTNIKTVNSNSLLGSGNVAVQDTLVSGTNIKTVNSNSLLGSGNLDIIEKGSSGSVYYTKYNDGTIIYYANIQTASIACSTTMGAGGGFRTSVQTLTLPVALVNTGNCWVTVTPSDSNFFNISGSGYVASKTTVYWVLHSVSSDATTRGRSACIVVHGRWK